MMIDLVQRLRDYYTEDADRYSINHPICDEAADEIERLRAENERWAADSNALDDYICAWVAAKEYIDVSVCDPDTTAAMAKAWAEFVKWRDHIATRRPNVRANRPARGPQED